MATGRTQIMWCVQVTGEISRPEVAHNATPRKGEQRKCTYLASATPRTPRTPARVHCSPGERGQEALIGGGEQALQAQRPAHSLVVEQVTGPVHGRRGRGNRECDGFGRGDRSEA